MTEQDPLNYPCPHAATPQESGPDPLYLFCGAQPGQPCRWGKRFDRTPDPTFHSERFEAAMPFSIKSNRSDPETLESFNRAVLATGLI